MRTTTTSSKNWLATFLSGSILVFGISSAALVMLGGRVATRTPPPPERLVPILTAIPSNNARTSVQVQPAEGVPSSPKNIANTEIAAVRSTPVVATVKERSDAAVVANLVSQPALPSTRMPKKNKEAATVAPVVKKQTEGDNGPGDFLSSSVKRAEPSAEAILGDNGTLPLKSAPHSGFKPLVAKVVGSPVESPSIVMTTEDKAWVRLDAQSTQIFKKGQVVPGLGVFLGADKKSAKFDTGSVPLSAE